MMQLRENGTKLRKFRASIAAVIGLIALAMNGCSSSTQPTEVEASMETLTIPFDNSVLREPLVNVVLPARVDQKIEISHRDEVEDFPESPQEAKNAIQDRVRFVGGGMLVTQPATQSAGRVTGVKLLVPVEGDFEMNLHCAIHRLDQPTEIGAHGLAIRFLFRNSETKMIMFGCMASPNCKQCLVKRVRSDDKEKAEQSMTPLTFSTGTWTVTRYGPILDLDIRSEDGDVIGSETAVADIGVLIATEIWCTRLPQGNAHAEIELRKISMKAPQLFPVEPVPQSYLTWIRWGLLLSLIHI